MAADEAVLTAVCRAMRASLHRHTCPLPVAFFQDALNSQPWLPAATLPTILGQCVAGMIVQEPTARLLGGLKRNMAASAAGMDEGGRSEFSRAAAMRLLLPFLKRRPLPPNLVQGLREHAGVVKHLLLQLPVYPYTQRGRFELGMELCISLIRAVGVVMEDGGQKKNVKGKKGIEVETDGAEEGLGSEEARKKRKEEEDKVRESLRAIVDVKALQKSLVHVREQAEKSKGHGGKSGKPKDNEKNDDGGLPVVVKQRTKSLVDALSRMVDNVMEVLTGRSATLMDAIVASREEVKAK